MPMQYPVPAGTIVLCDYAMGGFREPEMVKKRPAVVVSPRFRHRSALCTVVPFSTSRPHPVQPYHCLIAPPRLLPPPWDESEFWAKADMLATVGLKRLDLLRTARDQHSKRRYLQPKLCDADLWRIQLAMLHALGLDHLTPDK